MDNKGCTNAEEVQYSLGDDAPELNPGELLLGTYGGFDALQRPRVALSNYGSSVVVQSSMVPLNQIEPGREVALMLAQAGSPGFVIIGVISKPKEMVLEQVIAATNHLELTSAQDQQVFDEPISLTALGADASAQVDGERLVIDAKEEIVLRCGEASITLSKNGKIAIRGRYILNRAKEVNRILGGSVQVN